MAWYGYKGCLKLMCSYTGDPRSFSKGTKGSCKFFLQRIISHQCPPTFLCEWSLKAVGFHFFPLVFSLTLRALGLCDVIPLSAFFSLKSEFLCAVFPSNEKSIVCFPPCLISLMKALSLLRE